MKLTCSSEPITPIHSLPNESTTFDRNSELFSPPTQSLAAATSGRLDSQVVVSSFCIDSSLDAFSQLRRSNREGRARFRLLTM